MGQVIDTVGHGKDICLNPKVITSDRIGYQAHAPSGVPVLLIDGPESKFSALVYTPDRR